MKGTPIDKLVYEYMFPKARPNDPENFNAFLSRLLIGEVRSETQAFYGHLETQEAKYPGLDYTNRTHRLRLARFPWHRRLFRAFDNLGLTNAEIANLTRWEGTKWAKEKYELEHHVLIQDTTDEGFGFWDDEKNCCVGGNKIPDSEDYDMDEDDEDEDNELGYDENNTNTRQRQPTTIIPEGEEDEDGDEEEEDTNEIQSVGVELNNRLRESAARREAGDTNVVMDPEWEQWLKHVVENGLLQDDMSDQQFRVFFDTTIVPAGLVPTQLMTAAREGRWAEIPDYLHSMVRRNILAEDRLRWANASGSAAPQRRTFSDLRLPVGDAGAGQMTADAPGA